MEVMEKLPVRLTQEELATKALELAAEVVAKEALQGEKDLANENWRGRIKTHEAEITRLSQLIVAGAEERDVQCRREYDVPGGYLVRTVRTDTGATVLERPMTDDERERVRQGDLFPPGEPASAIGGPEPTTDEAAAALVEVARRAESGVKGEGSPEEENA